MPRRSSCWRCWNRVRRDRPRWVRSACFSSLLFIILYPLISNCSVAPYACELFFSSFSLLAGWFHTIACALLRPSFLKDPVKDLKLLDLDFAEKNRRRQILTVWALHFRNPC